MLLKSGSKGEDVKKLQEKLGLTADGDFGLKTETAVKAFQTKNGLTPDGVVGPKTWETIMGKNFIVDTPQVAPQVGGLNLDKLKGHIPDAVISQIPETAAKFKIDTPLKLAHFLAQVMGETGGTNILNAQENLNYTTAQKLIETWPKKFSTTDPNLTLPYNYINNPQLLANLVYCCKMGNGDKNSGEGWLYRGRGTFQLTFKDNYNSYLNYLTTHNINIPYTHPDNLSDPNQLHALLSGLWYFKTRIIDAIDIENASSNAVTNKVNKYVSDNSRQIRQNKFNQTLSKLNC